MVIDLDRVVERLLLTMGISGEEKPDTKSARRPALSSGGSRGAGATEKLGQRRSYGNRAAGQRGRWCSRADGARAQRQQPKSFDCFWSVAGETG